MSVYLCPREHHLAGVTATNTYNLIMVLVHFGALLLCPDPLQAPSAPSLHSGTRTKRSPHAPYTRGTFLLPDR